MKFSVEVIKDEYYMKMKQQQIELLKLIQNGSGKKEEKKIYLVDIMYKWSDDLLRKDFDKIPEEIQIIANKYYGDWSTRSISIPIKRGSKEREVCYWFGKNEIIGFIKELPKKYKIKTIIKWVDEEPTLEIESDEIIIYGNEIKGTLFDKKILKAIESQ